jgi:Fe-S cluster assembly iron-binding protein IscA
MSEARKTPEMTVEVTAAALAEMRKITAEKENQGKAVRVLFRGFG